jgi:hypothetical protein
VAATVPEKEKRMTTKPKVTRLPRQDPPSSNLDPAIHGIGVVASLLEKYTGNEAITDEGEITSMAHVLRAAQNSLIDQLPLLPEHRLRKKAP